jgi:hypothetical protein
MSITQRLGACIAVLATASVLTAAPAVAQSVPLFPAQVSAANIDCIFGTQCAPITPRDETTDIALPAISGKAILQSRTFEGTPGSKAPGRTAYQYRVDLSNATTLSDASCITNLSVDFGPVVKLPYAPGPTLRDVYEIVQGVPPNQVGFSGAEQTGDVVTFTFARPLCAGDGVTPGATSFFFGLASLDPPVRGGRVQMDVLGLDNVPVKSFSPRR